MKWNTECAIPKIGCPVGISDLKTLPHKVETAQWNCFRGNVRNLLAVLSQSNDCIEEGLSSLTRHGDLGCSKGNLVGELSMFFQDVGYGAHPQFQAIQVTKENIRWWCGDESQTKFGEFAFFPGKALSKRFLHSVGQGVNNGLKVVVCLGKNVNIPKHYHYPELCGLNIVMGDVEYYWKMITLAGNSWLKDSIVL